MKNNTSNESTPKKSLFARIKSYTFWTLSVLLAFFCVLLCFTTFYNRMNGMPPSFGGIFCMQVSSGSMTNSGFEVGDKVIVRSVDTHTLKPNQIVAFYALSAGISTSSLKEVDPDSIGELKFHTTFAQFFGVQNDQIKQAAKNKPLLVFHHIRAVYEDAKGHRYFKTYGSSNGSDDTWIISEDLIVGSYDSSFFSNIGAFLLNLLATQYGIFLIMFIAIFVILSPLIINYAKDLRLALIEYSVVQGKRKLTDNVCVKNRIGFRMDDKTKLAVLARAKEEDKLAYVDLLWETRKESVYNYYLGKLPKENLPEDGLPDECPPDERMPDDGAPDDGGDNENSSSTGG